MAQLTYGNSNILNEDADFNSVIPNYYTQSTLGSLYDFDYFVFTNAGKTGTNGPTYSDIKSAYSSTLWTQNQQNLSMTTQGVQLWTVPETGIYTIVAAGAACHTSVSFNGPGRGVVVSSNVFLNKGDKLKIIVGQVGYLSSVSNYSGGGGTFVATETNLPILVAGGGGGGWTKIGDDAVVNTSGTNGDSGSSGTGGIYGKGGTTSDNRADSPGAGFYYSSGNQEPPVLVNNPNDIRYGGYSFIKNGVGAVGNPPTSDYRGGFGGGGGDGGGGFSGGGGVISGGSGKAGGGGSYDINGPNNVATLYTGNLPSSVSLNIKNGYNVSDGFVYIKKTTMNINFTNYYQYFRLIVTGIQPTNNTDMSIPEFIIYDDNGNQYPPVPLSGNSNVLSVNVTGQAYGNGTYNILQSTTYFDGSLMLLGVNAFDKNVDTIFAPITGSYNGTTGIYTRNRSSTDVFGNTINGEWIQIQLPSKINIGSYTLVSRNDGFYYQIPYSWVLAGSNDGSRWVYIDSKTNVAFTQGQKITFGLNFTSNQYPPAALTATAGTPVSTTLSGKAYGNGVYTASTGPNLFVGFGPSMVFDRISASNANLWTIKKASYNASGLYDTSLAAGVDGGVQTTAGVNGEWVQLQLPVTIVLKSYILTGRESASSSQNPKSWTLFGSNDGSTWSVIDTRSNITTWNGQNFGTVSFSLTNSTSYSFFRIVITSNQGSAGVALSEWALFGYE